MVSVFYDNSQRCNVCGDHHNRRSLGAEIYKICNPCFSSFEGKIKELEEGFLRTRKLTFKERIKLQPIEKVAYRHNWDMIDVRFERMKKYKATKAIIEGIKPRSPRKISLNPMSWSPKSFERFKEVRNNGNRIGNN